MDIEMLHFRAGVTEAVRSFFRKKNYLEVDTPALSPVLIPEACLEVFETDYIRPSLKTEQDTVPLFLVPSPEIYIKQLVADHKTSMFQISKCYRNVESAGRIHSPEFTMLEYYTMDADYLDSIRITEDLISHILERVFSPDTVPGHLKPPYESLSVNEAFEKYAGFSLAECAEYPEDEAGRKLAAHAERLGCGDREKFAAYGVDDLYEVILVQTVEPGLSAGPPVFLTDYPVFVPCLAQERETAFSRTAPAEKKWRTKERWELYIRGVEIANCYSEERNEARIEAFFSEENREKLKTAKVPHPVPGNFGEICARMPPCSGVAAGLDRLIMVMAERSSIDSVLPFPLTGNL
ncbi:elongation factor P--(R)-beta-lysine ligase [Brucepastera parasyntrophica]|uniref:amino acid--tRNA ligase-related protein n=1 Tax=Brucepastera parasyntrophica TaxID=2880008 RepID=UPI002108CE2A|nr:amino acid--tRNA ligase-related protein [Brucepastera parasyntrophica]ULQ59632.1 elongation factor P--(R)-beta-lysine ligase [Brucepastera parasyntrophica]